MTIKQVPKVAGRDNTRGEVSTDVSKSDFVRKQTALEGRLTKYVCNYAGYLTLVLGKLDQHGEPPPAPEGDATAGQDGVLTLKAVPLGGEIKLTVTPR